MKQFILLGEEIMNNCMIYFFTKLQRKKNPMNKKNVAKY